MSKRLRGWLLVAAGWLLLYLTTQVLNASGQPEWVGIAMAAMFYGGIISTIWGMVLLIAAQTRPYVLDWCIPALRGFSGGAGWIGLGMASFTVAMVLGDSIRAMGDIKPSMRGFIGFTFLFASPCAISYGLAIIGDSFVPRKRE